MGHASKRIRVGCLFFFCVCFFLLKPSVASSGISTDGTIGPAANLSGPDYQITHELGSLSGKNLFHSFDTFSIANGESATFTGPDEIANVISRVTGGAVSSIDGLLRSEVGTADFYFINPAGVVFGENAQVDVPAAFHVSTADELRFEDGAVFSAADPVVSSLTVAQPESFGFLSPQPEAISINGASMEFTPESRVSLSAGSLEITSSPLGNYSEIYTPGGEISLTATGNQTGSVSFVGQSETTWSGNINIENGYIVTKTGEDGSGVISIQGGDVGITTSEICEYNFGEYDSEGGIWITAENLDVSGSFIVGAVYGDGNGGTVQFDIKENIALSNGTYIGNYTQFGDGETGDLLIESGSLTLNNAFICTESYLSDNGKDGKAGSVTIRADESLEMMNESEIYSSTYSGASTGDIKIKTGSLVMDDSKIETKTEFTDTGDAGQISVKAEDSIEMTGQSYIVSSTGAGADAGDIGLTAGTLFMDQSYVYNSTDENSTGNAGSVDIEVAGRTTVDNGGEIRSSSRGYGNSGNIQLNAEELFIYGNSGIKATSYGYGNAGNIGIHAENILLNGRSNSDLPASISTIAGGETGDAGHITITAENSLQVLNGADISVSTVSQGNAGNVLITANSLLLASDSEQSASIKSESVDANSGDAGNIILEINGLLEILDGGSISSMTGSSSNAGQMLISADQINMAGTGYISGSTFGQGNAGTIGLDVTGLLSMEKNSGITNYVTESGNGGSISVTAGQIRIGEAEITSYASEGSTGDAGEIAITSYQSIELVNGGVISSWTNGSGNGGTVGIKGDCLYIDNMASDDPTGICADSLLGSGDGGVISIDISGQVEVLNGGYITSITHGQGNAGDITLQAESLILNGQGDLSLISSSAISGSTGDAGSIDIGVLGTIEIFDDGVISSSTFSEGDAGKVAVNAGRIFIDGQGSEWFTGISSEVGASGTGKTGDIAITADRVELFNNGAVSIAHEGILSEEAWATFTAGALNITAGALTLGNGSEISALSTENVPASHVKLTVQDALVIENTSRITTEANTGNGGNIIIDPVTTLLRDGQITTSSVTGRGGDISLASDLLVLDTGFIQANAIEGALGGDILINADAIIAWGDNLMVGGEEPLAFEPGSGRNIIQAAAPGGVQGSIDVTAPELDIAASLIQGKVDFSRPSNLASDPCSVSAGQGVNSLVLQGRGGMPFLAEDFLDVSWNKARFERLLKSAEQGDGRKD
jgi:filamentous hemagglutinin family protein